MWFWTNLLMDQSERVPRVGPRFPEILLYALFSPVSSRVLSYLASFRVTASGHNVWRQVHPWMPVCRFITGLYMSIWGFSTLLKGTSEVLWRCYGPLLYYQNTFHALSAGVGSKNPFSGILSGGVKDLPISLKQLLKRCYWLGRRSTCFTIFDSFKWI